MKNLKNSLLLLLLLTSAASIAEEAAVEMDGQWSSSKSRPYFKSNEEWLSIPLHHSEIQKLRETLEKREQRSLHHAPAADLKVITASEWRILKQRLTMDEIEKLALKNHLMNMPIVPVCLSKVETLVRGKQDFNWVLVLKADKIRQFRREVWRYYVTKGGAGPDFQWKKWYPCVSIGASSENFDEELALKYENACSIAAVEKK